MMIDEYASIWVYKSKLCWPMSQCSLINVTWSKLQLPPQAVSVVTSQYRSSAQPVEHSGGSQPEASSKVEHLGLRQKLFKIHQGISTIFG